MKNKFHSFFIVLSTIKILFFLNIKQSIAQTSTTLNSGNGLTCTFGTVSNGTSCIECGDTDFTPNIKIVGGVEAVPYSWPAQVLVVMSYKAVVNLPPYGSRTVTEQFQCGGTLITQKNVLTAAHCIVNSFTYSYNGNTYTISVTPNIYYPTLESMFTVYLGVFNIGFLSSSNPDPSPGIKRLVSKVLKHPSYNSNTDLNDITLLTLTESVELGTNIKLACLPKESSTTFPATNQYSYASGWGTLTEGGSIAKTLYNVRMTIYDKSSCSNVFPVTTKDWNSQICSGEYSGGKDTCQGDSGGGLYVLDSTLNKFILSGITSYGLGCARAGLPGIYTRVSFYIDWIRSNWAIELNNGLSTTVASTSSSLTTSTVSMTSVTSITSTAATSFTSATTSEVSTTSFTAITSSKISTASTVSSSTTSNSASVSTTSSNNILSTLTYSTSRTVSINIPTYSIMINSAVDVGILKILLLLTLLLHSIFLFIGV